LNSSRTDGLVRMWTYTTMA